ncbi:MAG: hypothetical protein M3277_08530 [Actinomycetota bacterium]|nr:hypothetical protein [Actinomycetota bacterium]
MKKTFATCLAIGLLAGALIAPADAAKKRKPKKVERVMEAAYDNPAIGIPGVIGSSSAGGAVEFGVTTTEAFVDVEITDDFGQPVIFTMSQDTEPGGTGSWEIFGTWCGGTEEPVSIAPGIAVRVSVYTMPGPNQPSCMGPATSGAVKATFSNLP